MTNDPKYDESGTFDEFGVGKARKADITPLSYEGLNPRKLLFSDQRKTPIPQELQAAIEAFEAVASDATALKGRSPKAAIEMWLRQHKPELSKGARERISMVANWKPTGGAPKTPGNN